MPVHDDDDGDDDDDDDDGDDYDDDDNDNNDVDVGPPCYELHPAARNPDIQNCMIVKNPTICM